MADMQERQIRQTLDRIVRRERGRLVAGLVHRFGGDKLALIEDTVQDAVLSAMASWPYQGLPDDPGAWLYTAARNRAIDRFRRENRETGYTEQADERPPEETNISDTRIKDPELQLIFLCCQSTLSEKDQLMLTLKVVSGFTAGEIATLFLEKEAAVGQRLYRAKKLLQTDPDALTEPPSRFEIAGRLQTVLKVIYLMFAVGYAPRRGDTVIRREIAYEAIRMIRYLLTIRETTTVEGKALAALLLLQASRFEAREDTGGNLILLRDQDRKAWDGGMIAEGVLLLEEAKEGNSLSRYHIEAGIAAIHGLSLSWDTVNWGGIRTFYSLLETFAPSPIVSVNAAVAQAFDGDPAGAKEKLRTLSDEPKMETYAPYHVACAEVDLMLGDKEAAASKFEAALACPAAEPVSRHLENRLAGCF